MKVPIAEISKGLVHCPICTHTVPANVAVVAKRLKVVAGQKCDRCHSSLDAAAVLYLAHAA
jgi:transposase-like protein